MYARNAIALLGLLALAVSATRAAPLEPTTTGRYIIRLAPEANPGAFDRQLKRTLASDTSAGPGENKLVHTYTMPAMRGYAGVFSAAVLEQLRNDPNVVGVEEDSIGHLEEDVPAATAPESVLQQPSPASWGLARVSQRKLDLTKPYLYPSSAGSGVTAYIIDSGIQIDHPEFEGRASWGKTFVAGEKDEDGNGHGSHVAGTIAGKTYGIAKKAKVVAVKVCSARGSCATSDVIAGMQFVIKNAQRMKSTINISLKLAPSQLVDDAVQAAVDAGIAVIVSGGNDNGDSCLNSPRRAPNSFAVGATDKTDKKASFSNYGKCIKVYAPGTDIMSSIPGSKSGTKSGTSMASPHVCGIAALYLAEKKYDSILDLHKDLIARSSKGKVTGLPANTTTNMIFSLPTGGEPAEAEPAVAPEAPIAIAPVA